MSKSINACVLRTVALCVLITGTVISAPSRAETSDLVIEEIIVTARKREEAAHDVPIPITALSGELQKSTVRDLTDLNGFAPNVQINRDPSRTGGANINIRGISPTGQ